MFEPVTSGSPELGPYLAMCSTSGEQHPEVKLGT